MVPIAYDTTVLTGIDAHRQRHLLSMPTIMACLGSIGRGHFDHGSLSFFHFKEQRGEGGVVRQQR